MSEEYPNDKLFRRTLEELLKDKNVFFSVHASLGYPFSIIFQYNSTLTHNLLLGYRQDKDLFTGMRWATFEAYANYKVLKDIGKI